ncbi:YlzJ-like family protein [Peribacillus glennii]|uniref:Ribonuclease n=1 Tax=Peribacillus glennii TaxID=2303991 RepID=A0A372L949_9BACI|nr:YlzJ-like family protein [Peribacillus glennii]RFU61586.1 ribonuclease [Peribacillus glennii]
MILYTLMPLEQIFPAAENEYSRLVTVNIGGVQLSAEMQEGRGYRVERILSTDPAHYLDQSFQPGSTVYLND